jgi:hypothetical protein
VRLNRVPLSRPLRARLNGAAGCAHWQAWLAALAAALTAAPFGGFIKEQTY